MCGVCQNTQPWFDDCFYEEFARSGTNPSTEGSAGSMPVFTYDQIATQLTETFWGGSSISFDVTTGDTLFVDISELTANGQAMALQALDAWTVVTGLNFVEVYADTPPTAIIVETADAPSAINTNYVISAGEDFLGELESNSARDTVAVFMTAGQVMTFELDGEGNNELDDPFLFIKDGSGATLAQNDDANSQDQDSEITYQAAYTGYHYIEAASFNNASSGDYRLSVREGGAVADIIFDDENSGAYASMSVWNGTILSANINIDPNWAGGANRTDGYFFQTYIHEIGHALGLGHAGNYNGNATYGTDNLYANDSWQATVMSYFHQIENTSIDADFGYVITPQIADILAVHDLYGAPGSANVGDTIYGDGGNTGTYLDGAHDLSNPISYTVFDTGGSDVFDFSSSTAHQIMDLREEMFSDLDGRDGNVGIARDTVIEHGRTGGGNDEIIGNAAGNELRAGFGNDTVDGGGGNDALLGGSGNDALTGGSGADMVTGGTGDNILNGNDGGDLLIAGDLTLDMLLMLFPSWTPPANAADLVESDDYIALWNDIVDEFNFA